METQRLLLYLALGFLSLIIWQTWVADYHTPLTPVAEQGVTGSASPLDAPRAPVVDGILSGEGEAPNALAGTVAAAPAGVEGKLVRVTTDVIDVALDTVGGTIAEVDLLDYAVSVDRSDEPFTMMSSDPAHYLIAQSGLQSTADTPAPTHREPMQASAERYTLEDGADTVRVPFTWVSPDGVEVTKTFTFTRDSYEVGIDYAIVNGSAAPYTVNQYRQLKRKPGTKDERQQFVNTYIGGVLSTPEDRYTKIDFGDMEDENLDADATDGWVAMIQHYFAAAWIPTAGEVNTAYSRHLPSENRYLIGLVSAPVTVPAGGEVTLSSTGYIGPKIQDRLAAAAPHLELTVDFGWLTILSQPLFWLLKTIHSFVGNWGWSIILVTFCIKAVFYKLSEAGYRSMGRMKLLQPKLAALKEKHGDDRAAMGQATMELYKKERVNPLGGCLPMLVQIPVFIAFYWMLLESVELRQAPWILWIQDLSIRDPLYILPVVMAATMYFQQKLNPAPVDPIQQKVFAILPFAMGIFFAFFPAGLVLYWVVNNVLGIAQQYYITRHVLPNEPSAPPPSASKKKGGLMSKFSDKLEAARKEAEAKVAAKSGGVAGAAAGKASTAAGAAGAATAKGSRAVDEAEVIDDVENGSPADDGTPGGEPKRPHKKKRGGKGGKGRGGKRRAA